MRIKTTSKRNPISFGYEMEQPHEALPIEVWNRFHGGPDGSGPYEIQLPRREGVSNTSFIMEKFSEIVKAKGEVNGVSHPEVDYRFDPWEWKGELDSGQGCGCHLHVGLFEHTYPEIPVDEFRAIVYNTLVELLPIFAPFWTSRWDVPIWRGTNHRAGVDYWAKPYSIRWSPQSFNERWNMPHETNNAITLNPPSNYHREPVIRGKPTTLEIRIPEAHPAMVLTGAEYLREIISGCLERRKSVKIKGLYEHPQPGTMYAMDETDVTPDNLVLERTRPSETQDITGSLKVDALYDEIYTDIYYHGDTMLDKLFYPHRDRFIVFERGIPYLEDLRLVENFRDILTRIIGQFGVNVPLFARRISKMLWLHIEERRTDAIPENLNDELFLAYEKSQGEFRFGYLDLYEDEIEVPGMEI